jgi:hypothetical protein
MSYLETKVGSRCVDVGLLTVSLGRDKLNLRPHVSNGSVEVECGMNVRSDWRYLIQVWVVLNDRDEFKAVKS